MRWTGTALAVLACATAGLVPAEAGAGGPAGEPASATGTATTVRIVSERLPSAGGFATELSALRSSSMATAAGAAQPAVSAAAQNPWQLRSTLPGAIVKD